MRPLPPELRAYLDRLAGRCRDHYGDELRSVVLFGSLARGTYRPTSDVDLLVVVRRSASSVGKRLSEFLRAILEHPEIETAVAGLRQRGLPWRVEAAILTEPELASHPPLLLDLTEDAVVLEDAEGVFTRETARVRARLEELGARRVWLTGDRWYWVLTPAVRPGEVITI